MQLNKKTVILTISGHHVPLLRNILTHAKSAYGAKVPHENPIVTERRRIIGQLLTSLS